MSDKLITEEQKYLDQTVFIIDQEIARLEKESHRKPNDYAEAQRIQMKNKKLSDYKKVRSKPYFGRFTVVENDGEAHHYYIGERSISKEDLYDIVYDWRTPFAEVFYKYGGGEETIEYHSPAGPQFIKVCGKRDIIIEAQKVVQVYETGSVGAGHHALPAVTSSKEAVPVAAGGYADTYLHEMLSQSHSDYQLKKIVATIQKEQNDVIRLGIEHPIIIQGAAGSGKTAIALHRLSYLLYRHRKTLSPEKLLILAPSQMFIQYMKGILPDLEIEAIQQNTFIGLARKWLPSIRSIRSPQEVLDQMIAGKLQLDSVRFAVKYKGSIRFRQVVEKYLKYADLFSLHLSEIKFPKYVNEDEVRTIWQQIYNGYSHLPMNLRRKETLNAIKSWIDMEMKNQEKPLEGQLLEIRSFLTNHLEERDPREKEIEKWLKQLKDEKIQTLKKQWQKACLELSYKWRPLDTFELYQALFQEHYISNLDPELSLEEVQQFVSSKPMSKNEAGYEDLAALLLIEHQVNGLKDCEFDYIVIDEAQDLNPFQFSLLKDFSQSMTILGDMTQSIYDFTGIDNWEEIQEAVFEGKAKQVHLNVSYRSSYEIIDAAKTMLQHSGYDFPEIIPFNRRVSPLSIRRVTSGNELIRLIRQSIDQFRSKGYKRIAVISKEPKMSQALYGKLTANGLTSAQLLRQPDEIIKESILFVPLNFVKGLEFDAVIIDNANKKSFDRTPLDTKLLFVGMTRAQHELHMYYYLEPSPLIVPLLHEVKDPVESNLDALL